MSDRLQEIEYEVMSFADDNQATMQRTKHRGKRIGAFAVTPSTNARWFDLDGKTELEPRPWAVDHVPSASRLLGALSEQHALFIAEEICRNSVIDLVATTTDLLHQQIGHEMIAWLTYAVDDVNCKSFLDWKNSV